MSSTRAVEVSRISGFVGGVDELQILRDELEIDQPAGGVFEVPALVLALLLRDRLPHLDDVAGDRRRHRAGRHSTARITSSTRAANAGGAETTRARVSAMCSQVQASLSW